MLGTKNACLVPPCMLGTPIHACTIGSSRIVLNSSCRQFARDTPPYFCEHHHATFGLRIIRSLKGHAGTSHPSAVTDADRESPDLSRYPVATPNPTSRRCRAGGSRGYQAYMVVPSMHWRGLRAEPTACTCGSGFLSHRACAKSVSWGHSELGIGVCGLREVGLGWHRGPRGNHSLPSAI